MKSRNLSLQLLILVLTLLSIVQTTAQTLDATFTSPATTQCAGSLFTLNASTLSYQSYNWTITGSNNFSSNLSGASVSLNLPISDIYNVSLTVSDGISSETNTVNSYLNVMNPATVNAGVDQTICSNSTVSLSGIIGGSATSYSWSGGTGTFSPNNSSLTSTYSPSSSEIANGFALLILMTNDPAGPCLSVSDTVMIVINQNPIPSATASSTVISCFNPPTAVTFTNTSSNNVDNTSAVWNFNSTSINSGIGTSSITSTNWNPTVVYSLPGTYIVTLQVSSLTGCNSTVQQVATVTIGGPSGTVNVTNSNLTGCSCYTANMTVTTANVTEARLEYGDGQFLVLTPNTTQNVSYSYCNSGSTTITRTPTLYISNGTCNGFISSNQTINIKPIPIINPISDQIKCSGMYSDAVNFIGNIPNATYTWSRTNTDISASPLYTSGLGNIPAFLTNNPTITQVSSVFTVTPSFEGCIGSPINFTITVNPPPVSTISTTSVCVGGTVTTTPNTGGTWASTNAVAATITNSGIVSVGNSSTQQIATLRFTETTSGCFSDYLLTVNPRPTVSVPALICVGSTAQLSPSTGGTWNSSNAAISTINANSGLATGVSPGNVTFTFTNTVTGCSNTTTNVTINALPTVSMSSSTICVNGTVQLNPNSGGTWTTNNPSIASLTSTGIVTGLAQGTATFTFTNSTTGCTKTTQNLNVGVGTNPVISVPSAFCDGTSVQLLPSTGGTWTSSFSGVATVTNSGMATGLASGFITFTYVNTVTGCSATSSLVEVYGLQQVSMPYSSLCLNSTMQLSPSTGGTWVSNNPSVASITNDGLVTGLTTGTVNFTFTNSTTGCIRTTSNLTVIPLPTITLSSNTVCVNSSIQINSNNQFNTYSISNMSVASFGSNGIIGIAEGTFFIAVSSQTSGCMNFSEQITVISNATVDPIPNQIVCTGDLVSAISFSGSAQQYNWTNDNVSVGLGASGTGNTASFIATNPTTSDITSTVTVSATGCSNTSNSFTITVKPTPTISPTSDQTVCHNDFTQLVTFTSSNPNAIYEWQNNNSSIGLLQYGAGPIPSFQALNTTAIPQVATFIVVPTLNGCPGTADTFLITVNPASTIDPIPNQIVCTGDLVSAITFSGSAQQYNWTNDNVSIGLGASGTGNIASFIATNPTASDIVSTVTVSATGCSNTSNSFTITVKPMPTVSSPPDLTRCHNDSTIAINFSGAINGTDYSWTTDNATIGCPASGTGNIPAFQVQNASTVTQVANFVVTPILNGCVGSTINFDITVLPLPIVNAGNDTTICLGESYTPIVTGSGLTFTWNNGVFYNTPFTPSSTNTYTVIGSNNICNNSDSVTVTVNPIPQLTISTFDGEDSLACDGTLSVTVVSGTAPYTYAWTNGSGNFTTPIIENLCSGIYNLTVIDVNGCMVSNSGVINDTLIPTLTGDTLIFTDNIYQDSTIIDSDTSAWIDNCTFDYNLVTGATIDSYVDSGDSTFVTWIISLSDGTSIPVVASYFLSPGTAGVYELTLQLTCSQKSGPKFLISTSRIYYEGSTIGIEDLSSSLIILFPNPATSTISIVGATETFQYEIRDIQGKLVKQGATEKEIDIASLTTGTYLISISSDKEMKQLRFVKL